MGSPPNLVLGIRAYPGAGAELFVNSVVKELQPHLKATVVAVTEGKPWNGPPLPTDGTIEQILLADPSAIIYSHPWKNELDQGNDLLDFVHKNFPGCYLSLQDTDEVLEYKTVQAGIELMEQTGADVCRFYQRIFWKDPIHIIIPDYQIQTIGLIKMSQPRKLAGNRHFENIKEVTLPLQQGSFFHFAYCRPGNTIKEKLGSFSHASEIISGWIEDVWNKWDLDHNLQNLHPINPSTFLRADPIHLRVLPKTVQVMVGYQNAQPPPNS